MAISETRRQLARHHLERAIEKVEQAASEKRLNTLSARSLAGAATLLGESDIAARATRLLQLADRSAFFAGAITNIELPAEVPQSLREPASLPELETKHPIYDRAAIHTYLTQCAKDERHIALCLNGQHQEAIAAASSDLRLEEIGDTLAVLSEFPAAWQVVQDSRLPLFRQHGVQFILAIELFRAERTDEAERTIAELEAAELSEWCHVHLALALSDRLPWIGYPYPDW